MRKVVTKIIGIYNICWRLLSSGMWRRAVWYTCTNVHKIPLLTSLSV